MLLIVFFSSLLLVSINRNLLIPIYLVSVLVFNSNVRLWTEGPSYISILSLFFILFLFFTQKSTKSKYSVDRFVSYFFIYYFSIYIPFFCFCTDLSLFDHVNAVKGSLSLCLGLLIWEKDVKIKLSYDIIYIALILVCVYGIYSYYTSSNIYLDLLAPYLNNDLSDALNWTLEDSRGLLSGRISGTSVYPIPYGILMCLFFYFLFFLYKRNKHKILFFVFALIFINIYLTGSRGALIALFASVLLYEISCLDIKKSVPLFIIIVLLLFFIPLFEKYFSFFVTADDSGSSVEGRSVQFYGAYSMVDGNIQSLLFGRGGGYVGYYLSHFGPHPLALCFESAHVCGIVEYGILGLIFIFLGRYAFLYFLINKAYRNNEISRDSFFFLFSFLVLSFIYSILVGQVYQDLYIVLFFIMLKKSCQYHIKETYKKRLKPWLM